MRSTARLFLLFCLFPLFAVCTQSQATDTKPIDVSSAQDDVLKLEEVRNKALVSGDASALAALYTEDLVYTNAKGLVLSKEEHLSDVRSGRLKLVSLVHKDVKVHMHGSTAVVTGLSESSVRYNGELSAGSRRFMDVYVLEGGRWLCAVHFETPIR